MMGLIQLRFEVRRWKRQFFFFCFFFDRVNILEDHLALLAFQILVAKTVSFKVFCATILKSVPLLVLHFRLIFIGSLRTMRSM